MRPADQLGLKEGVPRGVVGGDVPFHAVEHVLVALTARRGHDGIDVGAGSLLGDRVALFDLAPDAGKDVPLELIRRRHRREPGRRRGRQPRQCVGHPADLFLHEDLLEHAAAAPAQLGRHVGGVEAQLVHPPARLVQRFGRQVTVVEFGVLFVRNEFVCKRASPTLDLEVLGREVVHFRCLLGS